MKKILLLLIVGILVLTGFEAVSVSFNNNSSTRGDELDQYMTEYDGQIPVGNTDIFGFYANLSAAQSFTPEKEIQTRIQLFMARNIDTIYPCYLVFRDDLTGEDLASVALQPSEFPVVTGTPTQEELSWVEFNFQDIKITPGQTYYVVVYTANVTDNYYWIAGNGTGIYPNGNAFFSIDDGQTWEEIPEADACFKTYGRDNHAPDIPLINGPTKGKPGVEYSYTFVAEDLDGDDVYYWILWGDGCPAVEWIGPYASGEVITLKHTYTQKGTFTISCKAKDVYDAESDWGYLEVSIPRTRTSFVYSFLDRFPNMFPILRYILGLY
jgi:hypothetical protein